MNTILDLTSIIASPKRIVITTHERPDADALGSSLALAAYLLKKGHSVKVIAPTEYPEFLYWMPGNDQVLIYSESTHAQASELVSSAEMVFCLDFNRLSRISHVGELVRASDAIKVLIDHHLEPEDFDQYRLWDVSASSTCELIYRFIDLMGDAHLVDDSMAQCIYAGIVTDTGSFRFPSCTKHTHLIISKLLETGMDHSRVHRLIYDDNTENRLRFLGHILQDKLVVLTEYQTAYITISEDEYHHFQAKTGDTEGFVNYALSIRGIIFAVILIEKSPIIKMSFRSVGDFSANDFAKNHFNGGGHKNAAGGKSDLSLADTEATLLALLPKYKQQLLHS